MRASYCFALAAVITLASLSACDEAERNDPSQAGASAGSIPSEPEHAADQNRVTPAHLERYFASAVENGYEGVLLVADGDGAVRFEAASGLADRDQELAFTVETGFDIGSNAKAFTAAAILLLVDRGDLALETAIGELFADAPSDKAAITIHQLLTHQGGLADEYIERRDVLTREEMELAILSIPLLHEPGREYAYSDMSYALLSAIVERVSGQPYRDFVNANIFAPLGMSATGFLDAPIWRFNGGDRPVALGYSNAVRGPAPIDGPRSGWSAIGPGMIVSTSADILKWMMALQSGDLLSEASRALMFARHVETLEGMVWYGYGWNIVDVERGRWWSHTGAAHTHSAYFAYLIDQDLFVITGSHKIDGVYVDENNDGVISDSEIVEEAIYAIEMAGSLIRSIQLEDDTIQPEFLMRPQ